MLDRDKVINWWTGRISDPDLAEWTGMAPRAVAIVLNLPHMRSGVAGGGRGSRHTRRIHPKTRNAVAIVQALSEAGITFELATNIIGATPILASTPTEVVDYRDTSRGFRILSMVDPKGNWLPSEIVPWHVWERFVVPCTDVAKTNPGGPDDIDHIDFTDFEANTERGTMIIRGPRDDRLVEFKPLTDGPVYLGEIDPFGFYLYEKYRPDALPQFDDHLLIVDGRWIFHKGPDPQPADAMRQLLGGRFKKDRGLAFRCDPLSVIEADKKTVRVIGWGGDEEEQERARYHLENYESLLDVNMTLAVRKMKRRAYGLPVGKVAWLPWEERVRIAQRYSPPSPVVINAQVALQKEDFFRKWMTDTDGNRVLVGLTKEETDEFDAISFRDWESRTNEKAFPWPSMEEMHREKDRWLELRDKHETARQKRTNRRGKWKSVKM